MGTHPALIASPISSPLINAARNVTVLVTGRRKAGALQRVHEQLARGGPAMEDFPITGVRPTAEDCDMT